MKQEKAWEQEFYIRPKDDEANEKIARILARFGNIEKYERSVELPGYSEKQGAYLVSKSIMNDVDNNKSVRNQYEAFVRKTEHGKLYRHRTPEQIARAKDRRAKKEQKRTRMTVMS
jgi:hypothetical protein